MNREKAIDIFEDNFTVIDTHGHYTEEEENLAIKMAIEALDQVTSYERTINKLTEAISEQEPFSIETYCKEHFVVMVDKDVWEKAEKALKQEPKTGRWQYVQYDYNPGLGNWHCSECRCVVVECVDKNEKGGIPLYKYCPQCGAKMKVGE